MAKVLAILDVNSEGHVVRLSDGSITTLLHTAEVPSVGAECGYPLVPVPPPIALLNSLEQISANMLSEIVNGQRDDSGIEPVGLLSDEFVQEQWPVPTPETVAKTVAQSEVVKPKRKPRS